MYLTDDQLSQLRTRPHRTKLNLAIFRPRTVFATQITQPGIAKSDRDITVNGLSGEALSTVAGMTVYIGTSQGTKDIGRIRLRSATSTVLTLAENSIDWEDGWYLTVVRYFEPWGVFPRIILDNDDNPIFYKDWDTLYTDQNEDFDPVVCMGPNDAGILEQGTIAPTGTHRVWYTSSGTYDPTVGGTLSAYLWHMEGGTPTGSTAAHPGFVTYTGEGNFVTSLTVTTTGGKSFTGRRHVRVMARPDSAGNEKPINAWGVGGLHGDRDSGGWTGEIWMREPANPEDIVDGALVVIFSEDFEGGVETKVGANAENRGSIFFVGYILEDSTNYDPETNVAVFGVGGTSARMAELATFDTALDDVKSTQVTGQEEPPWTRMPSLTVDRAMVHFLRWHSTVLATTDFSPTLDTLALKGADIGRGNLWDVTNSFLDQAIVGQVVSDRQGKLWTEVRANVRPTGSDRQPHGHMQPVIEMTNQDWRTELSIDRGGDAGGQAYLEMSGVAWSGATTGTFDAYLSGAPGKGPDYFGIASRIGNLALLGQDQLNQLAGNAWAAANPLYPNVTFPLAGDYRFLDIAPQHRVELTLAAADTWRQITWNQKTFIPNSITYEYRPSDQILLMEMDLKEETFGGPGETIIIPVDPPYDQTILPDWDIDFPPIVPPDPPEPPIDPPPGTGDLIYLCTGNRLTRSRDFVVGRATGSSWTDITPTWGGSSVTGVFRNFYLDPTDPVNVGYLHTDLDAEGFPIEPGGPHLYKVTGLNGPTGTQSYEEILDPTTFGAIAGASPGDGNRPVAKSFAISPISSNVIFGLGRVPGVQSQVVFKTANGGASWSDETNAALNPTTGPSHGPIFASPFSVVNFWTVGGLLSRQFYSTLLQGATWALLEDSGGSLHDGFHMPVNGNPIGHIWYWTVNSLAEIYATDDNFVSSAMINPVYDGEEWWAGNSTQSNDQEGRPRIATWAQNRLRIAALCHGQTSTSRFILFHATDGVLGGINSWLPRYEFAGPGGTESAGPLLWHDTNQDLMALIFIGDDDQLWLSVNEGVSWIGDGLDRWEEDIGTIAAPDSLGFVVAGLRWPSIG